MEKTKQEIATSSKGTLELEAEVKLQQKRAIEIVDTKVENEKKEIEVEAEASKIKLLAEAKAIELARPIEEKAKAEQKLLDVYGQNGMGTLKLLEILPELAEAQALALSNIKIDSLHIIGGENGGNQIGGLATDIIKSIPAIQMANDIAKGLNIPHLNIVENKE